MWQKPFAVVESAHSSKSCSLVLLCGSCNGDRTLPATLNTPLYWSSAEKTWLQGTMLLTLVNMMQTQIDRDWQSIILPIVEAHPYVFHQCTKADYIWALSNIWSRAFSYTDKHGATQVKLILLNHRAVQLSHLFS
jgi:hypothetical protein